MRKVELRMNEQEKYETIKYVVEHNGSKKRASIKLGISIRQINRLIIIYKEKGKAGFVHGNRTRKPINAFDNSISEDIILLYNNKYQDFNFRDSVKWFGDCIQKEKSLLKCKCLKIHRKEISLMNIISVEISSRSFLYSF